MYIKNLHIKSIRTILIVAFLLGLLLPTLAITLYGHLFTSNLLSQETIERSKYEVHLQAQNFVHSLDQIHGDAHYLAQVRSFKQLRDLLPDGDHKRIDIWRDEASQDFLVFASVRPMFYRLRYLDRNGDEIISLDSDETTVHLVQDDELKNLGDTEYFRQTMQLDAGQVYVSSFELDSQEASGNIPIVRYAMRLPADEGILVFDIFASWLLRSLPDVIQTDSWGLINQDGQSLVYPVKTRQDETPDLSGLSANPTRQPYADQLLGGMNGVFETYNSVYVFNRIYPTASTSENYWVLYRDTSKDIFYAGVNDFYRTSWVILAIGLFTALALALYLSRQFVSPIISLERIAHSFGSDGALPPIPDPLPAYEIGTLTKTFYDMADELERRRIERKALIKQLINAAEEERKLIAYDLHDGLIQQLVGARLYLSSCHAHCPIQESPIYKGMKQGSETLSEAIVEGRRIIEGLHPTILDDLGLAEAIEDIAYSIAEPTDWQLNLEIEKLPHEPEKTISVTMFRIVQEALNNIRKHANASQVHIQLHNGDGISLRVKDNGKGFDRAFTGESRGFGITTMQERASLIHGTCEIQSKPGEGTCISIWVPYEKREENYD